MRPRGRLATAIAALLLGLTACGTPADGLVLSRPVVLLGEVHDNATQHAMRLQALRALLARGARPALVMEQFDREQQAAIDARRQRQPPPDAAELIAAAHGDRGWHWPFYVPYIELALQYGLPIVAANVGRDEARAVMRDGLAAHGFDAAVPPAVIDVLAQEIEASHCGQVNGATARRMALAQVARDQSMARAVEAHADRGAVLLAGNGHVRTDIGVPRWLSPATRARTQVIGLLEQGDPETAFDQRVFTPRAARTDPCEGMRRPG